MTRERGDMNRNPHMQGAYDVDVLPSTVDTPEKRKAFVDAEKKWVKQLLNEWYPDYTLRVKLKRADPRQRDYLFGYQLKDEGLEHYIGFKLGVTDEEAARLLLEYRSKAGDNAFAGSGKMNKAPHTGKKQIDFTNGNLHTLATWFVDTHKIGRLRAALTLPIIVAYALSTNNYRIDETIITGKNGGVAMAAARSEALMQLNLGLGTEPSTSIPLIETILYGSVQRSVEAGVPRPEPRTMPTTDQLARWFDLAAAKALCAELEEDERL